MYENILMPVRFQPMHLGHCKLLREALEQTQNLILVIYQSDKTDFKNPLTGLEREELIREILGDEDVKKIEFVHMPYFKESKDRLDFILKNCDVNEKTLIVSGSSAVKRIFEELGNEVKTPSDLLGKIPNISGSKIREMILRSDLGWKEFVPKEIISYLGELDIKTRLKEFKASQDL